MTLSAREDVLSGLRISLVRGQSIPSYENGPPG